MRARVMLVLALVASAAALTVAGLPLAAAPAADLVATHVAEELPLRNPNSTLWDLASPLEVPMSGQLVTRPQAPEPSVDAISVRALTDGEWIAFRIDWSDATKDDGLGHDTFKDGVAVQFPVAGGAPFVCMGMVNETVSMLHWRSDFQADLERGEPASTVNVHENAPEGYFPMAGVPSFTAALGAGNPLVARGDAPPVESLLAGGFGTLEATEANDADGWAVWSDGTWSAVIARPLAPGGAEDAALSSDEETSLAFAVWDGARGDINGKKSVSGWVTLGIATAPAAPVPTETPAFVAPVPTQEPEAVVEEAEEAPVGAYVAISVFSGIAAAIVLAVLWTLILRRPGARA